MTDLVAVPSAELISITSNPGQVIEPACLTFTHELVRPRLISPSQESQRYGEYGKTRSFDLILPPTIEQSHFHDRYVEMAAGDIPGEDARYILPGGTTSKIVISANFRKFRHIFRIRRHPRVSREIRRICLRMLEIMKKEAPIVFNDFQIDHETDSAMLVAA